ncbi:MAG: hypothetical protein JWQ16_53, partial [Novosphingobium sp.]|nr:hypothetical protein [Novosphingobium sp.]
VFTYAPGLSNLLLRASNLQRVQLHSMVAAVNNLNNSVNWCMYGRFVRSILDLV